MKKKTGKLSKREVATICEAVSILEAWLGCEANGVFEEAQESAEDAIYYLDQFMDCREGCDD